MIYFAAHTFKCVCHCRRAMFRVLGMYNFEYYLKSKRIWQMLVFNLQILALQAPVFTEVDESKYVQFSEELPPQFSVTKKKNTFEYFAPKLLKFKVHFHSI